MAQLHWLSNYQAIDANGEIIVGALLYTYNGAGTILQATYEDNPLSSANTNPIVADANGYFGSIFVRPEDYAFELRNAADVTIWTLLNANSEEDVIRPTRFVGVASGTANDIILTASDIPSTYVDGQVFQFIASATNTGAMTVDVIDGEGNNLGVRDIVRQGGAAMNPGDVIANFPYSIQFVASINDFVIQGLDGLFAGSEDSVVPADADEFYFTDTSDGAISAKNVLATIAHMAGNVFNASWSVTVDLNAITIALKTAAGTDPSVADPVRVAFRSTTDTTSAIEFVAVTSAISLVISDGSTLGFSSSESGRLYIGLLNNAGTIELCAWRSLLSDNALFKPDENGLTTTVAEGGAGGADSAGVVYSETQRTDVVIRIGGYFEITTGATAGQWATAPTKVQTVGPGIPVTGKIVQTARDDDGAGASGTTLLQLDNTIPQNTEGDEYLSQAIVPSSALNIAKVLVNAQLGSSANNSISLAVFDSQSSDALGAITTSMLVNQEYLLPLNVKKVFGTSSSVTFSARAGGQAAGTTYFNQDAGSDIFGGVCNSFIEINEVFV